MLCFSVFYFRDKLKPLTYLWPIKSQQHHVKVNKYHNNINNNNLIFILRKIHKNDQMCITFAGISWGSEFQSFGAATWNDLSPNVTFVLIDGAASKIPLLNAPILDVERRYAMYKQQYLEMDTPSYRELMQISH